MFQNDALMYYDQKIPNIIWKKAIQLQKNLIIQPGTKIITYTHKLQFGTSLRVIRDGDSSNAYARLPHGK